MEIDKLIEGADIMRFMKAQSWSIFKEWTKQDQLGSCQTGNLWEVDQQEDQDNDGKMQDGRSKKPENQKLEGNS